MGFKILAVLRYVFMAICIGAYLLQLFIPKVDFVDTYVTNDLLGIYLRNWLIFEAFYWAAKYKALSKSIEDKK